MKSKFKYILKFISPFIILILSFFLERQYLKGRFFEESFGGFSWAFRSIWVRNILRIARPMPFPVSLGCTISNPKNLIFHPDDLNNFQSPGTYFQNFNAKIFIGKGVYIAPNVGLITANHDLADLSKHQEGSDIIIGAQCWIGMGAIIMPGINLGENTIVAAGAIVTKSFPEGNVILAGVPAKVLKRN